MHDLQMTSVEQVKQFPTQEEQILPEVVSGYVLSGHVVVQVV